MESRERTGVFDEDETQEFLNNDSRDDDIEEDLTSIKRELYILKQEINNLDNREISDISNEDLLLFLEDLEYYESYEFLDNEVSILKNKVISFLKIKKIHETYDTLYNTLNEAQNGLTASQTLLDKNIHNIKSEILTMMGLFFAIFAFIQINFIFIGGFLERYSGYKLIFFITSLNIVLMLAIAFILEVVGAIVYGENRVREKCESGSKYFWIFKSSKLKLKRSLVSVLSMLVLIASFSFFKSKDDKILNYKVTEEDKNSLKDEIIKEIDKEKIKMELREELRSK